MDKEKLKKKVEKLKERRDDFKKRLVFLPTPENPTYRRAENKAKSLTLSDGTVIRGKSLRRYYIKLKRIGREKARENGTTLGHGTKS